MKDEKLTPKQERFCQEYVVDYNGAQAAIRAGYSERTARNQACVLLTKPNILARVRELQAEQVQRLSISQDYVVLQLMETYARCMAVQPVMVWDPSAGGKVESGEYVFDSKGALRALELLGKHLGMFDDRLNISGGLNMGCEKLDQVIAQLMGTSNG